MIEWQYGINWWQSTTETFEDWVESRPERRSCFACWSWCWTASLLTKLVWSCWGDLGSESRLEPAENHLHWQVSRAGGCSTSGSQTKLLRAGDCTVVTFCVRKETGLGSMAMLMLYLISPDFERINRHLNLLYATTESRDKDPTPPLSYFKSISQWSNFPLYYYKTLANQVVHHWVE